MMARLDLLGRLSGLASAIKTLTVFPWPGRDADDLSASLPWFPVVGFLLGAILNGLILLGGLLPIPPWPALGAILLTVAEIYLTRGLHLDGLADWADSIGGMSDREKRLAIMKDTSLGSFGVLALILAVLIRWIVFEWLLFFEAASCIIPPLIISRGMMVELIATLPYARIGEGMGRPFVMGASTRHRVFAHLVTVGLCIPFGPFFLLLYGVAWVGTWCLGLGFKRSFGGITGDLLGAANEMVELGLLMICGLLGDFLTSCPSIKV